MLIRLVSHSKNNKLHLDKFIAIEGIPDHMLYETRSGNKCLKGFLGTDVPENIPKDIKREFFKNESINRYIAPFEKGAEAVFQEVPLYSVVIDCATRQGADLWNALERMIDDQTPRDRKVVEPVVVAKDLRSGFTITSEDVPVVTLQFASETPVETIQKKKMGRPRKEAVGV